MKFGTESKGIAGTAGVWARRVAGIAREKARRMARRFMAVSMRNF
jgi:hypothetical protein